jgi:hypothetical protein
MDSMGYFDVDSNIGGMKWIHHVVFMTVARGFLYMWGKMHSWRGLTVIRNFGLCPLATWGGGLGGILLYGYGIPKIGLYGVILLYWFP